MQEWLNATAHSVVMATGKNILATAKQRRRSRLTKAAKGCSRARSQCTTARSQRTTALALIAAGTTTLSFSSFKRLLRGI